MYNSAKNDKLIKNELNCKNGRFISLFTGFLWPKN